MSCSSSIRSDDLELPADEDEIIADVLSSDSLSWELSSSASDTGSPHSIGSTQWRPLSDLDLMFDHEIAATAENVRLMTSSRWTPTRESGCFVGEELGGLMDDDAAEYEDMRMDLCLSQPLMDPWESPWAVNPFECVDSYEEKDTILLKSQIMPLSALVHLNPMENRPTTFSPWHSLSSGSQTRIPGPGPAQCITEQALRHEQKPRAHDSSLQVKGQDLIEVPLAIQLPPDQIITPPTPTTTTADRQPASTLECQPPRQDSLGSPLYISTEPRSRPWVIERIESKVADLFEALAQGTTPQLEMDSRGPTRGMTEFDPEQGIFRRRRRRANKAEETAATTVSQSQQGQDPAIDDWLVEMAPSDEMGATSRNSNALGGEEDLFEQYDEKNDRDISTIPKTLLDPVAKTTIESQAYYPPSVTTSSSPPPRRMGTKVLRMTQSGIKQLAAVVRAMDVIHESVQNDVFITKRDLFYRDVVTFRQQSVVDRIIDDLASTWRVPRSSLHVFAGTRGLVYGAIRLTTRKYHGQPTTSSTTSPPKVKQQQQKHNTQIGDSSQGPYRTRKSRGRGGGGGRARQRRGASSSNDTLNNQESWWIESSPSSSQPQPIPALEEVSRVDIDPRVRFVLVIEKEATIRYLISTRFCEQHGPCILLTGKGNPDRATRQLLNCLARMVHRGVTVWYPNGVDEEPLEAATTIFNGDVGQEALGTATSSETTGFHAKPKQQCLKQHAGASTPLPDTARSESLSSSASSSSSSPWLPTRLIYPCSFVALVDCDPHGFYIYFTYKHGSPQMAFDNLNLAVPQLRCLGQVPQDWTTFMDVPPSTVLETNVDARLQKEEEGEEEELSLDCLRHSKANQRSKNKSVRTTKTMTMTASTAMLQSTRAKARSSRRTKVNHTTLLDPLPYSSPCPSSPTTRPFHPWDRHLRPLTSDDRSRLLKLLTMPYVVASPSWQKQLCKMLKMNRKSELQSLYESSCAPEDVTTITTTPLAIYLMQKLNDQQTWL